MEEAIKLLIGGAVLVLGFFIGNWIARNTPEEIKEGKNWFFGLVLIGLIGGIYGLVINNDFVLFTFFFIAIVSSRSLRGSLEEEGSKGGDGDEEKRESKKRGSKKKKSSKKKSSSKKSSKKKDSKKSKKKK